jgi:hypothetical protein
MISVVVYVTDRARMWERLMEDAPDRPGSTRLRYRYIVRITSADVGRRVVVRWLRPVVAGPDEVADVLGILESADGHAFHVRDKHGDLIVVPRERALAAKMIPQRQ